MKEQLKDTFVEIEMFDGIRGEIEPLRKAAMSNVEVGVEERERVKERLSALGKAMAQLSGGRELEVVGRQASGMIGGPEEMRKMKMAIEGIEGAVQREIRKLKRNVRKVERDLEDFVENDTIWRERLEKESAKKWKVRDRRKVLEGKCQPIWKLYRLLRRQQLR
jgi:ribosome-associated translation inhibitor RaiA